MRTVVPMLIALLLTIDADALTKRRACRLACGWKVDQCIADGGRRLRCRRRTVRDCKRFGLSFCAPPPTTTTTLEPVQTPTTSTTVRPSTSTTTSTTLPVVLNAAGVWSFSGSLIVNDCGLIVNQFVTSTITVQQSGTFISGTMGRLPVSGEILGADSWQMLGTPTCEGSCCTGSGIRAGEQVGNHATGVILILSLCTDGLSCSVGYGGTLTR